MAVYRLLDRSTRGALKAPALASTAPVQASEADKPIQADSRYV